ncbi:YaaR family protein [Marinospirillum alkaliphilum]|uniref:DUF327 domain-containing protein n=1 Tax=Marinospirillum alkaliphilum DSM 21637 TaxID=1122209 RepID=A0A1K1TDY4_9GAMM|nr:YaaR family protein [Marinospirillum alkaliphilum]SFW98871.1 hypothetical protein SAMN02745752_00098 [Marinospirillum alkaliphilum DSM 21637]
MLPINTMLKNLRSDRQKGRPSGAVGRMDSDTPSFGDQLLHQIATGGRTDLRKELKQLQDLLGKAGDELERHPTIGNLEVFRALLSNLVAKVVKGGFQVESVGPGWHPADRHQVIRRIDEEAEELLQLVMNEQKDRVSIARSLVTIKGLVVDLLS